MKFLQDISYDLKKNRTLLFMILPVALFFLLFSYLPMAGIVLAFKQLDYAKGIFESPWIGFDNFRFFFMSGQAFTVTRNTVLYNLVFIMTGTVFQISLAIFLSELGSKYFKKITQGMMFLPYFISWVVVGAFVYNFFNYDFGVMNTILKKFGSEPVDITMSNLAWIAIIIFFQAWKSVGYGSVLYLAAIMGIDQEMYEAAEIDGANMFQRIWHITLPCLKPTMIVLILMAIGHIFRGDFGLFYQIVGNNGLLYETTDVIDTFVFRALTNTQEFGMAAASGVYQSVLCFLILTLTNYLVKKHNSEYALY